MLSRRKISLAPLVLTTIAAACSGSMNRPRKPFRRRLRPYEEPVWDQILPTSTHMWEHFRFHSASYLAGTPKFRPTSRVSA